MSRSYQRGLSMVRDGLRICQAIDKDRNLDAFLASQQRIKSRHNQAQPASECRTTATVTSADLGCHNVENCDD